jgi:preprotein translocase subunit SecG
MNVLLTIVLAVQILTALGMIGLILLQHGKGADMGAAFGSGASGSLFGATGSANFLSRTTAVLAAVFFVCTLALAYFSHSVRRRRRRAACSSAPPRCPPRRPRFRPAGQIPGGATGAVPRCRRGARATAVPAATRLPAPAQIPTK